MRDIWRECAVIIGYAYNSLINTSIYICMHACIPVTIQRKQKTPSPSFTALNIQKRRMTFTSWPSCHFQNFSLKDEQRCRIFKATWRAELVLYVGCGPLPSNIIEMKVYRDPLWKCKIPGGHWHPATASHEELAPNGPMISYVLTLSNLSLHHHCCTSDNQRKWVDIHIKAQWFITIGEINNNKWDTLALILTQIWLMTSPPGNHIL